MSSTRSASWRPRPETERYLAAVEHAVARPGTWIEVRTFDTRSSATTTAACLRDGYLRVEARHGQPSTVVAGRRWLATAAPVETDVTGCAEGWKLRVRR